MKKQTKKFIGYTILGMILFTGVGLIASVIGLLGAVMLVVASLTISAIIVFAINLISE